ncbi:MAG: thioredoxin domain-containing protein [Acidobacteria bacterium]|nr:thioredoxin domain-containing protein [Acidobacteriota bacterium]
MPNRLTAEQSPYLLQHKDNPVDWYPWGDAAFEKARCEDKPIFLSIGYSTCHWCHVMEHESFEDARIAEGLNRQYVSIKVDREERPDVDRVYMTFVQATTGAGGWPMSVWLTPSLEPFYGGTYFPPTARWGKPGFAEILDEVARVWREERHKVLQSASSMIERLRSLGGRTGHRVMPGNGVLDTAVAEFAATFDHRRGGFGDAPKFPRPSELLFLLREHRRTGAAEPRDMVLLTLRAMACGGMRDHVGGGFHRYSVDGDWRVPHFEKMLYDQAQLVLAYVEAAQLTSDPLFAQVAADTLEYVRRDLTHPEGGFYSAEDADSVPPEHATEPSPHKSEGAFYIWRDEEIGRVLGEDADVVRLRYGILPDGNAPFDPQNEFTCKNLLYAARSIDEIASMTGRAAGEVAAVLDEARDALMSVRSTRPRPHLDDKVLTAWNGLMIAACARAGRVLRRTIAPPHHRTCLDDARRAAAFVRAHLWKADEATLLRRYRQGESGVEAYAEDYAYLIFGLLELFQADGDPGWLDWALTLQRRMDALFWDARDGGWYSTTGKDASVLLRLKEEYDGAEPAATSVALLNLLTLSHLTGDAAMAEQIEHTFGAFGGSASMRGRAVPMMLAALSTYHAGMSQVVIAGEPDEADCGRLMDVVRRRYMPTAVVIPLGDAHRQELSRLLPWITDLRAREGRATAYVCRDFACQRPTTSADELGAQLEEITHT